MILWAAFGDQWSLNQKVDFNPIDKIITTTADMPALNVQTDIFDAWKAWQTLYNNSSYAPALSGIQNFYFLLNDWQFVVDRKVTDIAGYLNPGEMIAAIKGAEGLASWNVIPAPIPNPNINSNKIPIF